MVPIGLLFIIDEFPVYIGVDFSTLCKISRTRMSALLRR